MDAPLLAGKDPVWPLDHTIFIFSLMAMQRLTSNIRQPCLGAVCYTPRPGLTDNALQKCQNRNSNKAMCVLYPHRHMILCGLSNAQY